MDSTLPITTPTDQESSPLDHKEITSPPDQESSPLNHKEITSPPDQESSPLDHKKITSPPDQESSPLDHEETPESYSGPPCGDSTVPAQPFSSLRTGCITVKQGGNYV